MMIGTMHVVTAINPSVSVSVASVECVSVDVVEVHATLSTHTLYVGAVVGRFIYERCLSVIKQLGN